MSLRRPRAVVSLRGVSGSQEVNNADHAMLPVGINATRLGLEFHTYSLRQQWLARLAD